MLLLRLIFIKSTEADSNSKSFKYLLFYHLNQKIISYSLNLFQTVSKCGDNTGAAVPGCCIKELFSKIRKYPRMTSATEFTFGKVTQGKSSILLKINSNTDLFFFLSRPFTNHRIAEEGEGISLTPHYHFHPLHRHLDISRAITAESSPLPDSNRESLVSERRLLTTSLRVLATM